VNKPFITDIQKYSIHDGSGIRTTIFFKGCPLTCTWCHNPETQNFSRQLLFQKERCTGCGSCVPACPRKAVSIQEGLAVTAQEACGQCGICTDYCLQNIRVISGKYYSVEELIREIDKDKTFYESSEGGVTLSGGEVLAQDMDFLDELLKKLYDKGNRVNIDTCGYVPYSAFERVLPYVDTFLYDVKLMDTELHKKYTGVSNHLILENLKKLSLAHAGIWIRIPVIVGVNASVENMIQTARFLKDEKIALKQINLLPYHNTGSGKYNRLQWEYPGENYTVPSDEELKEYITIFNQYGFSHVKTGG
jgi:pyruvate formate lyase activating enzyme